MSFGFTAAEFLQATAKRMASLCEPLDSLLDGGVSVSEVLEISGPPGCMKERLAMQFVSAAVRSDKTVLFVGTLI